jgi:hypothetical protein
MQNAITAFHNRIGVSRRELAKGFNVCDVSLGRRNKGHGPGHGRPGTNNALNPYQENAFCRWFRLEDTCMATPTVKKVSRGCEWDSSSSSKMASGTLA